MASPIAWGLGLSGTGVDTATLYPDYFAVPAIWLNSATGSDANAGTDPELPLKTTAQAVTNASAGSVIAVAATHSEITSSTVAVNKAGLRFLGFGTGTARATWQSSSGATPIFTVTAIDCIFDNLYLKSAQATPGTGGRITSNSSGTEVLNCQVDCGASDQEGLLFTSGGDNSRVENCTFTAVASRPTRAIAYTGAPNTNAKINNVVVDGATFGWAGLAVTVSGVVHLVIKSLTLAGNADLSGTATPTYQIFGVTTSGAGRVAIT